MICAGWLMPLMMTAAVVLRAMPWQSSQAWCVQCVLGLLGSPLSAAWLTGCDVSCSIVVCDESGSVVLLSCSDACGSCCLVLPCCASVDTWQACQCHQSESDPCCRSWHVLKAGKATLWAVWHELVMNS